MKNPHFTATAQIRIPNYGQVFYRAMQEAYLTGGNVRVVETQDGLVPATYNGHTRIISVHNVGTPVKHPGDYPVIYRADDGRIRSISEAKNIVDSVTAEIED